MTTHSETVTAFPVKVGAVVAYKNEPHFVRAVLSLDRIVVQHAESGLTETAPLDHLRHPNTLGATDAKDPEVKAPALDSFSEAEKKLAEERLEHLSELLGKPGRTREDVGRVAAKMNLSIGSVYRLIGDYQRTQSLIGLIPGQRGPKSGPRVEERVEQLLQECIESHYLTGQKLPVNEVYKEVEERCKAERAAVPHINTLRNRIKRISRKKVYDARGFPDLADAFTPTPGSFPAPPTLLAPVQMDHVRLDITVVFSDTRQPWGRPWLTLAIDVMTRMIVGFYLSMSTPNATASGMALAMGMLPKKDYLASLGLSGSWPVQGKIRKVHSDNAKEFRSAVFEHACKEQRIDYEFRPAGKPRYGGYIERLVGNVNLQMHKKPGATFSSPEKRGNYDSKKKSAFTLRELEVEIADWIVNHYHVTKHRGLGMPPINAWERAVLGTNDTVACGLPDQIANPEKLIFDFLPQETRVVSPTGIRLDKANYYAEVLNRWVNFMDPETNKHKAFVIKKHPRRRDAIWFLDPQTKQYYKIPQYPPLPDSDDENYLSGEEYSAIMARIEDEGEAMEDGDAKDDFRKRSKEREKASVDATKAARRGAKSGKARASSKAAKPAKPSKPGKPQGSDRSQVEDHMLGRRGAAPDPSDMFSGFSNEPIQPFHTRS